MSGKTPFSLALLAELAALCRAGLSDTAIAAQLGISASAVHKYRLRLGLPLVTAHRLQARRVPALVLPADGSRPTCPRCRGRLAYDPLDADRYCLACGWHEPPAALLGGLAARGEGT